LAGITLRATRNLAADLHSAAFFVYLSHCEGLGSGILLAMAAGVPVIASNVGGIPEIIRHEYNGLLTENTPEAIAAAMRRLAGDPDLARVLAARGRQTILEKFTVDHMVRHTLAVYQQVLAC
jgi:glycosyltransferase involved in cell wall biosynthesis